MDQYQQHQQHQQQQQQQQQQQFQQHNQQQQPLQDAAGNIPTQHSFPRNPVSPNLHLSNIHTMMQGSLSSISQPMHSQVAPISPQAIGVGFSGSPTAIHSPTSTTPTAVLLQQRRQQQLLLQQLQQQQQQSESPAAPLISPSLQSPQQHQVAQQQPQQSSVGHGQAHPNPNLPSSINTTAAPNSGSTQPSPIQQSPVSPSEPKPTSLQLLRQRQQQLEKERQLQQEKERQLQQEKERQLQQEMAQQQEQERIKQLEIESQRQKEQEQEQEQKQQQQLLEQQKAIQEQAQERAPAMDTAQETQVMQEDNEGDGRSQSQNSLEKTAGIGSHKIDPDQLKDSSAPTNSKLDPVTQSDETIIKTETVVMGPPPPPTPIVSSTSNVKVAISPLQPPQRSNDAIPSIENAPEKIKGGRQAASSAGAIGQAQVFKATYSGVPVYEMICKDVAVMRRRSDSYLNATQILKVAEFDKPQRTRILEREVQKGEHEKVQGGYGKYQGTWVPFERGLQLCREYGVVDILQPILYYEANQPSPPLAPKHVTAASNRPRKPREPRLREASPIGIPKSKKIKLKKPSTPLTKPSGPKMGVISEGSSHAQRVMDDDLGADDTTSSDDGDSDVSMEESASVMSNQSQMRTRSISPGGSQLDHTSDDDSEMDTSFSSSTSTSPSQRQDQYQSQLHDISPSSLRKRYGRPGDELESRGSARRRRSNRRRDENGDVEMESASQLDDDDDEGSFLRDNSPSVRSKANRRSTSQSRVSEDERKSTPSSEVTNAAASQEVAQRGLHADTILDYFTSDSDIPPKILTDPPADLDINVVIDGEGHTALHWAAAMAKVEVVKLLVQQGVDIYRVNLEGQTALMRSVLFTNNLDRGSFSSLLDLLQKTIFTIDKDDRTVFHHVIVTASQRSKVQAARYYLECLLQKLAQHPSELASIINVQDQVGDTALTIASRLRFGGKKLAKMLIDAGADLKIRNHIGKNSEDYLLEAEQATSSLSLNSVASAHSNRAAKSSDRAGMKMKSGDDRRQELERSIIASGLPRHQRVNSTGFPTQIIDQRGDWVQGPESHIPRSASSNIISQASDRKSLYTQLQTANSWSTELASVSSSANAASQPTGNGSVTSTQGVIPTVSDLFNRLTQSYEKDIFEKDQDIQEARTLLQGIQAEIREGHRTIHELKTKSVMLGKAQDQIRALESLIKQEIQFRQRLRIEELIAQEESKLRMEHSVDGSQEMNGELPCDSSQDKDVEMTEIENKDDAEAKIESAPSVESAPSAPSVESIPNNPPYSDPPTVATSLSTETVTSEEEPVQTQAQDIDRTPISRTSSSGSLKLQELEGQVEELQSKLSELQKQRKDRVDQIIQLKSQQGKRQHEYQRLIALCCNISIDQVDELLGPLLKSLGGDDNSK